MKTHQINESHLGTDATPDDARAIAAILTTAGYPSEYSSTQGIPTATTGDDGELIEIPDDVWFAALDRLTVTTAAATLGRKGGSAKSERKTKAVQANGHKGGRPLAYTTRTFGYVRYVQPLNGQIISESYNAGAIECREWTPRDAKKFPDAGRQARSVDRLWADRDGSVFLG